MTQRNPNPNATSSLSGWSKGGSSTTLTSTAEGARWVGGSSGTGRYIHIKIPQTSSKWLSVYVMGLLVRRNSGTAQLTRLQTDGSRWYDFGGGIVGMDGSYLELTTGAGQLKDIYYPPGQFIRIPVGLVGDSADKSYDRWADGPHNVLGFPNDDYYDVVIRAEDNKPFDFTIRGVNLYDNGGAGGPGNLPLDGRDAVLTAPTGADNSLTKTFHWANPVHAITTLKWEWGHGGVTETGNAPVSTLRDRPHTFPAPGVYTVKLTASDGLGGAVSTTQTVTVPTGPLAAQYSYETDFLNVRVDASDSYAPSLSPLDTYAWNWGDGQTTAANSSVYASHTYTAPGTYNVTLTVKDNATGRTDTETKALVLVEAPNPDNYFTVTKELLRVDLVPSIQDGTSYAWTFGDGGSSTSKDVSHTYASPGTYSVSLTVNGTLTTTQSVTVTDTYTPIGKLLDALRLQVSVPHAPGSIYNRLPNPSGERGTWGWSSLTPNSYITASSTSHQPADKGIGGPKLIYRSSGAGNQWARTNLVRVAGGQYVSAQVNVPYVDGYFRVIVDVFDGNLVGLGGSALTGYQLASPTAVVRTTPYLMPAGARYARVAIRFIANTSDGVPAVNKLMIYRRAMLATAATAAELTALPYAEYDEWVDLFGPTSEISVDRTELNVGTLQALILDSAYDPATDGRIRPGQSVRLQVNTADNVGNVRWESIFSGTVNDADVDYVPVKGPGPAAAKATRITLSATDAVTRLAGTTEPRGVAKIAELPELLENAGVPFEVNGSTGQIPTAQIRSWNDNASVLDQVAITRDTDGGYAYVDRTNVLRIVEPAFMPTAPVGRVDEAAYSGVAAGFNTGQCMNSVTIKWLRYTPAAGTEGPSVEEVVYGPYEDLDSIEEWGLRPATFTMVGVENPALIAAKGQAILDANSQPRRLITTTTIPIRHTEDLVPGKALLDLYDLVRLGYQRTDTDELARVTSVKHVIRATKDGGRWLMTLGFSADGAVATPQAVASPPPRSAGAGDWVPFSSPSIYAASWTDYNAAGGTYSPGAYQVVVQSNGRRRVYLRGLIKTLIARTASGTMFTLPAELAPEYNVIFNQATSSTTTSGASSAASTGAASTGTAHTHVMPHTHVIATTGSRVDVIKATGVVSITLSATLPIAANGFVSLEGMTWELPPA